MILFISTKFCEGIHYYYAYYYIECTRDIENQFDFTIHLKYLIHILFLIDYVAQGKCIGRNLCLNLYLNQFLVWQKPNTLKGLSGVNTYHFHLPKKLWSKVICSKHFECIALTFK